EKTKHQLKKFEHHTELFALAIVPALAVLGIGAGLGHTRLRRLPYQFFRLMQFAQPLWLLVGLAACAVLVWLYRSFDSRQRVALTQFASARLLHKLTSSVSASRRWAKRVLFALGVALLFVALARPQAGFEFQKTHRKGIELLFAV